MSTVEKIENLINRFCETMKSSTIASEEMDKKVLSDALTIYEKCRKTKTIHLQPNIWSKFMKNPIIKLATAAVVIIACLAGLSLWKMTGSGIVLADVLTRLDQVKAFRFKETGSMIKELPSGNPFIRKYRNDSLLSKEYGSIVKSEGLNREGESTGVTDIYFNPPNTEVLISHTQKQYARLELDSFSAQRTQQNNYRFSEAIAVLKEIAASKYETIGRSTIDGIEVEGFRTTDPNCAHDQGYGLRESKVDVKLLIDVKTGLPVQYESNTTGLDGQGARVNFQVVMYDFQWDVPADASEFVPPPIPDGYTNEKVNYQEAFNEQAVTEGLKQSAELFGEYPESLGVAYYTGRSSDRPSEDLESRLNKSDTPAAVRLKEELKGLTEQDRKLRLGDIRMRMFRGSMFYMDLTNDEKDPMYYGKTVTPKEADKILMRWKISDKEYRVIYGDLHAESVSPEKLSELEAALPK